MTKAKKGTRTGPRMVQAKQYYITSEQEPTLSKVASRVGVPVGTIMRHCAKDGWKALREQFWYDVEQQVRERQVKERAERIAGNLELVEGAKKVWLAHLKGGMTVECPHCKKQHTVELPAFRPTFGDLSQLLRLEELLLGHPDSRTALTADMKQAIDAVPDERLIEAIKDTEEPGA